MISNSVSAESPVGSILFVLNAQPKVWRAMEEFHYRLCRALVQRGVHPVVAFSGPVPDEIRDRMESTGATVLVLTFWKKSQAYRALRKVIQEYSVTVVHIRFFNYFQLVPWMARMLGVRTIIYTEPTSYVSTARGLKRWLLGLRAKLTTAPMTRIIAISQFVERRLIECGVPQEKIIVVYNGIDLRRFTPDDSGRDRLAESFAIGTDEYVLTTIARLESVKRVDVLLKACSILKQRGFRFRLFIVGSGSLDGELRNLSQGLNLEECIYWVKQTSEPELFLRGSDVFLLATEGEAFGNVLVEAMACGVAVIGSRSGAIEELILDGECGLLATLNDPLSFADAIETVLSNPELRHRFASAGVERARSFNVSRAVEGTLGVYQGISNDRRQTEATDL